MTGVVPIRPGRAAEAGALGRLIAESFSHLPLTQWLAPDPEVRIAALAGQFEMLVSQALDHGDVYVAGEDLGVAVWFPPGPVPDIPDYDARMAEICGEHLPRFAAVDEALHHAHPAERDHAFLLFLAVRESARNGGIGSALLDVHHRLLDKDATPAYLDASGLHSRKLYMRHGYTDHAEPYGPADADLACFYPMWREAQ